MRIFKPPEPETGFKPQLTIFGAWAGVTAIGAYLTPSPHGHGTHTQLGMPPCPSVLMFDRPCPGCGLTTSFTATIHGQFEHAFRAHPLGPLLYFGFTAVALLALYGYFKGLRLDTNNRTFNSAITAVALLVVGFGLVRAVISPGYRTSADTEAAMRPFDKVWEKSK